MNTDETGFAAVRLEGVESPNQLFNAVCMQGFIDSSRQHKSVDYKKFVNHVGFLEEEIACYAPNESMNIYRGDASIFNVGNYVVRTAVKREDTGLLVLAAKCSCPDYTKRAPTEARRAGVQGGAYCKHILATLKFKPDIVMEPLASSSSVKPSTPDAFRDNLSKMIHEITKKNARAVYEIIKEGNTPFLLGPTGTLKTTSVRMVARAINAGYEEISGAPSFADADLVGIRTGNMEIPGVIARSFRRARDNNEKVIIFFDEVARFNVRAQDILMRPLLPIEPDTARRMGIECDEPVRVIEAPMWGVEWAPVSKTPIVFAANPWGSTLDPAFVRRIHPIMMGMDEEILKVFDPSIAKAIKMSWDDNKTGVLPLPIEYQAIASASSPGDKTIFYNYLLRLQAIDPISSASFRRVLEGLNVIDQEKE